MFGSLRQGGSFRLLFHRSARCGQLGSRSGQGALLNGADRQHVDQEKEDHEARITKHCRVVLRALARPVDERGGSEFYRRGSLKGQVLYAHHIATSAVKSNGRLQRDR